MLENGESNGGMTRRALMTMAAAATTIVPVAALAQGRPALRDNEDGPYDLVIKGGRVIDPETGLDAVRDLGLKSSRIAAISERPLEGAKVLPAEGQVVAPGFIDLHAHGQQLPAA